MPVVQLQKVVVFEYGVFNRIDTRMRRLGVGLTFPPAAIFMSLCHIINERASDCKRKFHILVKNCPSGVKLGGAICYFSFFVRYTAP